MSTKAEVQKVTLDVLGANVTRTPISFNTLKEMISEEVQVKNWMHVRQVIQLLINEKLIVRTDSIQVEEYIMV